MLISSKKIVLKKMIRNDIRDLIVYQKLNDIALLILGHMSIVGPDLRIHDFGNSCVSVMV